MTKPLRRISQTLPAAPICLLVFALATRATARAEEGWVDLFNGADLQGWKQRGGAAR